MAPSHLGEVRWSAYSVLSVLIPSHMNDKGSTSEFNIVMRLKGFDDCWNGADE